MDLNLPVAENKIKFLYSFIIFTTFLQLHVFIFTLVTMLNVRMKVMVFRIDLPGPTLWIMVMIFATSQLFIMLPMNNFAAFYMIICRHLQLLIKSFSKHLEEIPDSEYEKVLIDYMSIRKFVLKMDNEMSFLVSTSTLYSACTMYFGMSVIMHPEEYIDLCQFLAVLSLFIGSSAAFLGLTVAGSLIHESCSNLWLQAHKCLSSKSEVTNFQQRFLSIVEKNLFVTVWKILPITRSFIFAAAGTVFTYCIALDSIQSLKNVSLMWSYIE
ncbi:hypothetical protein HNY73_011875 [Argiope bruennichi]|uniref:Uncharacterized protein n=1 Tax=Argiope bruennichi TaxID=94029 RepID=A0A8T0ET80_ARGBR|nr:hypothetical protein HNY73_011875 [Argiope bruennichi]